MTIVRRIGAGSLLALMLTGCSTERLAPVSLAPTSAAAGTTLCIASDCGSKTRLLDIPGAENILFTPEGRLFVSGSENVYEITRAASGWKATPLSARNGNFTGLAQIGNTLYANCFDGQLYAATLTATPALQPIHAMNMAAPNGLAAGPKGELYAVNGPLPSSSLPAPKVVRLIVDPANPLHVLSQTDWLVQGLSFPNGIQRRGNDLYVSDSTVLPPQLGQIKRVTIQADGSASAPELLGTFNGLPDDFSLLADGRLLLVSYSNNQILLMGPDGVLTSQTPPLSFDNPSQIRQGQPPLFAPEELLVTEKGLIGLPPTPGYGSALSVFRPN